jgi:hypothetical protein
MEEQAKLDKYQNNFTHENTRTLGTYLLLTILSLHQLLAVLEVRQNWHLLLFVLQRLALLCRTIWWTSQIEHSSHALVPIPYKFTHTHEH